MNRLNQLTRAEMRKVMGGTISEQSYNPNCGDTNPTEDYTCCTWDGAFSVGTMDCDSASLICANGVGTE